MEKSTSTPRLHHVYTTSGAIVINSIFLTYFIILFMTHAGESQRR